jgi:hypothetical protein
MFLDLPLPPRKYVEIPEAFRRFGKGRSYYAVYHRIRDGMTPWDALTGPAPGPPTTMVKTPDGQLSLPVAVEKFGAAHYNSVLYRIKHGWDPWLAIITPPNQKEPHE